MGGLTTAFELTATPELRARHSVTVYQLGWRLGGKGASGRNADHGNRIEEHGLHVWFGFYDNAFRLMRDAYTSSAATGHPLATFDDAFKPCNQLVLYDRQGDGWYGTASTARATSAPGRRRRAAHLLGDRRRGMRIRAEGWRWLRDEGSSSSTRWTSRSCPTGSRTSPGSWPPTCSSSDRQRRAPAGWRSGSRAGRARPITDPARPPAGAGADPEGFRDWLWVVVRARCDDEPRCAFSPPSTRACRRWRGRRDGVLEHGFDAINDEEWAAWLARHGAKEITLGATPGARAVLRSVYDVAFGYPAVDPAPTSPPARHERPARLAFSYRGSIMYKMQAGMGDAVFTRLRGAAARRPLQVLPRGDRLRLGRDSGARQRVDRSS